MPPVLLGHALMAALWPGERFGLGDAASSIARIDVAFVRELKPQAPAAPPLLRAAAPATRVLRAPRPASAAGSEGPLRKPLVLDPALREVPLPPAIAVLPETASVPELAAAWAAPSASSAPPPSVAAALPAPTPLPAAPATPAFEWPPSTRLSYLLTGNFRGPVEGQASVEWRLVGNHYQVWLELGIGPPFAPIVTRQLQSDGLVTAAGLEPRRYDENTHVALRAPRRLTITLDADTVRLPSGRELPRPPGVQDSASQFVQMTWLFTTRRELLQPGTALQFPLALPRHVQVWTYEVIGEEQLSTPVGVIDAVHVQPRRPARSPGSSADDLTAEFWVAPTLQYLPVRILIRQDDETYVDLHLARLPQQAAPAR